MQHMETSERMTRIWVLHLGSAVMRETISLTSPHLAEQHSGATMKWRTAVRSPCVGQKQTVTFLNDPDVIHIMPFVLNEYFLYCFLLFHACYFTVCNVYILFVFRCGRPMCSFELYNPKWNVKRFPHNIASGYQATSVAVHPRYFSLLFF